jgi:hypothetical protein
VDFPTPMFPATAIYFFIESPFGVGQCFNNFEGFSLVLFLLIKPSIQKNICCKQDQCERIDDIVPIPCG